MISSLTDIRPDMLPLWTVERYLPSPNMYEPEMLWKRVPRIHETREDAELDRKDMIENWNDAENQVRIVPYGAAAYLDDLLAAIMADAKLCRAALSCVDVRVLRALMAAGRGVNHD